MPTQTATWLDGAPAAALPLPDRGLEFGDGLFETLLLRQGEPLYPDFHWQRLQLGLQVLGFPDCLTLARKQLQTAARDVHSRGWPWTALRLTVSRGAGPRGYAPPQDTTPRIILCATQLDRDCGHMGSSVALCVATVRWSVQPLLAGIKHLNRLEQVLAAAECHSTLAEEAVMLDQQGHLASVTAGNLFLLRNGELITPALRDCGIEGTRRRLLIERWAPAIGLSVKESTLTLEDLDLADEVFYSNSLLGVRPVGRLGARLWHAHPVCEALFQQYQDDLA